MGVLTDGLDASSDAGRYTVGNNSVLTYDFDAPCLVSGVNIYSSWGDTGRDRIGISSVEVQDIENRWTAIPGSAVSYEDPSHNCFAKLADPDGYLATMVQAIRIHFGAQENGFVGYPELEVVGEAADDLVLANPVTRSREYVGSNAVAVEILPVVSGATQYQLVVGDGSVQPSAGGWLAYTPGMQCTNRVSFPTPATNGTVSITAWFRTDAADPNPVPVTGEIGYTTAAPTIATRDDVEIMLNSNGMYPLAPADIDDGTSDTLGIYSLAVSPTPIYTPGTVQVTFTAMNVAGNTSVSTVDITVLPFASSGNTWFVAPAGNDAGAGTQQDPFATVAGALSAASNGDMIKIGAGIYPSFIATKANIVFEGGFDTNTWAVASPEDPTIIRDTGTAVAVWFQSGAANCELRRLTIMSQHPEWGWNGVRFDTACTLTTFDSCVISNCFYGVANWGNHCPQSWTFDNCLIVKNHSDGIAYMNGNIGYGGNIGMLAVRNCTIADNLGDGICSNTGNPNDHNDVSALIQNTLFAFNRGAGYNKHGVLDGTTIQNCLFNGNHAGGICWYRTGAHVSNCSEGVPCFVDRANGDYRLAANSDAAAAGLDLSAQFCKDIAGTVRGVNGWDIGAYESDGTGGPAPLALTHVATTGSDVAGDGSASAPFATLSHALGRTAPGGEIRVADGTYPGDALDFGLTKTNITVRGAYVVDTPDWTYSPATAETIVDGNGGSASSIGGGNRGCRLISLTLRGGTAYLGKNLSEAAGVRIAGNNPVFELEACRIAGNIFGIYGALNQKAQITLRNCILAKNSNHAVYFGNAGEVAYNPSVGPCTFLNCTVADNGGSGFWHDGNTDWADVVPIARNTIFANNNGYGITKRGATGGSSIENCLFYGNASGSYLNIGNTRMTIGDGIQEDKDPLFTDAANGDYTLRNLSPAATVGMDLTDDGISTDIAGTARPQNGWDLGAYESDVDGAPDEVFVDTAYVDAVQGSDDTGDGSSDSPFASVTYALAHLNGNGTIYIAGGTYQGSLTFGNERYGITLKGGYDPATWTWSPATHATVIRSTSPSASPVTIQGGSHSNVFECLTLAGGNGSNMAGGIYFDGSVDGTVIEGCILATNYYGIRIVSGAACPITARNTIFARNSSHGVFSDSWATGTHLFQNCTFADNGGSGYASNGNPDWSCGVPYFRNCVFSGNGGFGIDKHGQNGGGEVNHCYFYANRDGATRDYSNWNMAYAGGNDGGRDPLFADAAQLVYAPLDGSPLIDSGTNLTAEGVTKDILGTIRDDNWDIGAYASALDPEGDLPVVTHVSTAGSDATGDGSAENPYATLDKGIGAVAKGGLVKVAGGTYAGTLHLGIGDSLKTVRGGYDPVSWGWSPRSQSTVVHGNGGDALRAGTGAETNTVACLTLTGATWNGGVRFMGTVLGLTLDGCRISGNYYGILNDGTPEQYTEIACLNCVISDNAQEGIYYNFVGDWRYGRGIGSYCTLANCVVANNGGNGLACSQTSGAGDRDYCYPDVRNTIFANNGKYALYKSNVIWSDSNLWGNAFHCLFYNNAEGDFFRPDFINVAGNIGGDPLFTSDDPVDPYAIDAASPAINAGTNSVAEFGVDRDILGLRRPAMRRYDIGAYEFPCAQGTMLLLR
ncbi:MAG: right-handed parallel beta-helix repeat-containing protein [Kiritimatiellia bacterium]